MEQRSNDEECGNPHAGIEAAVKICGMCLS